MSAWRVDQSVAVAGTLRADTPIHVGGTRGLVGLDQPVQTDGAGRPFVPGTSLAGNLRHWCARHLDGHGLTVAETLFGGDVRAVGRDGGVVQSDPASRLTVCDAPLRGTDLREFRHHNAIDRATGAVAAGILYEIEVLPAGSEFDLRLMLEAGTIGDVSASEQLQLLHHLVSVLVGGNMRLGAASSRGLGAVTLTDPVIETTAWHSEGVRRAVAAAFAGRSPEPDSRTVPEPVPSTWLRTGAEDLRLTLGWSADTAVLVQSGDFCDAIDSLPLMTMVAADHLAPVLPGSSVKGVFRESAERIVRTVRGLPGPEAVKSATDALEQWNVPLVVDVFGWARDTDDSSTAGLMEVEDCIANGPTVAALEWAAIASLGKPPKDDPGVIRAALDEVGLDAWEWRHHVAIDRWTGGAAEGLLFSELEPWSVDWPNLSVTIRRGRLDPVSEQCWLAALVLVGLVLAEFAAGRLRFGHGGGRGLGAVRLESINDWTVTGSSTREVVDAVLEIAGVERGTALAAWQSWVAEEVADG